MASKVTSNGTAPNASRARRGKAFLARATARRPSISSRSNQPSVQPCISGEKTSGRPLRLPPLQLELVGTRPPQTRWLQKMNRLRLRRQRRKMMPMFTFACRGRTCRQWTPGSPTRCSTIFPRALGRKTQFRCSCRHPRHSSSLETPAPLRTRVSRSCSLAGLAIQALTRWTMNLIRRQ